MLLNNVGGGAVVGVVGRIVVAVVGVVGRIVVAVVLKRQRKCEGERLEKRTMEEEETDNTKSVPIYSYIFSCLNDLNRFDTGRGQRAEVYIWSSTCVLNAKMISLSVQNYPNK